MVKQFLLLSRVHSSVFHPKSSSLGATRIFSLFTSGVPQSHCSPGSGIPFPHLEFSACNAKTLLAIRLLRHQCSVVQYVAPHENLFWKIVKTAVVNLCHVKQVTVGETRNSGPVR